MDWAKGQERGRRVMGILLSSASLTHIQTVTNTCTNEQLRIYCHVHTYMKHLHNYVSTNCCGESYNVMSAILYHNVFTQNVTRYDRAELQTLKYF